MFTLIMHLFENKSYFMYNSRFSYFSTFFNIKKTFIYNSILSTDMFNHTFFIRLRFSQTNKLSKKNKKIFYTSSTIAIFNNLV